MSSRESWATHLGKLTPRSLKRVDRRITTLRGDRLDPTGQEMRRILDASKDQYEPALKDDAVVCGFRSSTTLAVQNFSDIATDLVEPSEMKRFDEVVIRAQTLRGGSLSVGVR